MHAVSAGLLLLLLVPNTATWLRNLPLYPPALPPLTCCIPVDVIGGWSFSAAGQEKATP
jgi:hypothetical protein